METTNGIAPGMSAPVSLSIISNHSVLCSAMNTFSYWTQLGVTVKSPQQGAIL